MQCRTIFERACPSSHARPGSTLSTPLLQDHAYFFFLSPAPPLVFATPRNSFDLFFLCLPVREGQYNGANSIWHDKHEGHTLLSAGLLNLRRLSVSDESVSRLELLHRLRRVVDERKPSALATAVLCPEAEAGDLVFVGLVEFGEFGAEFIFADVRAARVQDVTGDDTISIASDVAGNLVDAAVLKEAVG